MGGGKNRNDVLVYCNHGYEIEILGGSLISIPIFCALVLIQNSSATPMVIIDVMLLWIGGYIHM